ncbi:urease accessory protein UreE [Tropicimonas aquimaris]|uniref:Urease accessory protein UreE n=1 Tax=Tropicimonas aquimaris TaxID=914152 RepID=A0ABW3IM95_9RHOB
MADLGRAHSVERGGGAGATDLVRLDYEGRFLRRRRLHTDAGNSVVVDLPDTTSLEDGDALLLDSGAKLAVVAAEEPLLAVTGANLSRLAWHIGNRHTPCRIEADRLLIREDHVLAAMLRQLGATVEALHAPFSPEGGAYGHGRTMGHDHGHSHDHGHEHGQQHSHE